MIYSTVISKSYKTVSDNPTSIETQPYRNVASDFARSIQEHERTIKSDRHASLFSKKEAVIKRYQNETVSVISF